MKAIKLMFRKDDLISYDPDDCCLYLKAESPGAKYSYPIVLVPIDYDQNNRV